MDIRGPVDLEASLEALAAPVTLQFFTQTFGCDTCLPARQIVERVAAFSDQITVEEYNLLLDTEVTERAGIRRAPAIAVVGAEDTGIRFYGVPEGHELISLVEAGLLVADGDPGLSEETRERLSGLNDSVDIQVFATPT